MSYKPLTSKQADDMAKPPLIEDGTYEFELLEFNHSDKDNKKLADSYGQPMTKICVKVWDIAGRERKVYTNLFWGEENKMSYRTRHFAESINMVSLYESGQMLDRFNQCLGRKGYCDIYIQKERPKNDGTNGVWPTKNDIKDFKPIVLNSSKSLDQEFNDSIPF